MTAPREPSAPGAPGAVGTIPLATPNVGEAERNAVLAAIDSGFVSSVGPEVTQFEQEFAELVGTRHAVATASGTAALHVALRLAGVGPGDEVFVSDFTFIGSANPVAYLGADVVLVDSEPDSWNMDPELLEQELDRRARAGEAMPRAIELVHVLGQPAAGHRIAEIARRHGIALVEDAAESLGARWVDDVGDAVHTGALGRLGAFSFNGNKIVTAGGGGMIVTDDDELARRARHLTTQAKVPDVGYLHDEVGYNYRLTNLAAALGLAQLRRLDEFVAAKRDIAARYDAAFADLPLTLGPRVAGTESTYWLYSVLAADQPSRDALLEHLAREGVGARALWRPLHQQPPFSGARTIGGDVATSLFDRGLSLPCSTDLSADDHARVVAAVRSFFNS
ncbi:MULTISPECIES: aminotransferase class I/II-fold pyridoxal phosphate-dependent enzyme [unclassified Nocardioides]|uniref:aminotransferase class I/II-fold pyridoxal phosphate-dependent enzyme n=1 Tax=unclassified Nocardioides TaxID=2615069 RepID=UPI0006F76FEA|nr:MULTISPECIES: aminotransferase class I/II-fold pyridoxal phosphate-dependent enzyme [unclassified Nocardioides]KQY50246.1 DegT/DnrJ/EryC1/StrS aminotransferase [Nocardioides sp. Root140]KQZ75871.1 DegT/DnrJ/EryC1/StrS aminotransferase [Nocardioides sp. Root151]